MPSPSTWASIALFFEELAPVVGPLFSSLSETSAALDRVSGGASSTSRALKSASPEDEE